MENDLFNFVIGMHIWLLIKQPSKVSCQHVFTVMLFISFYLAHLALLLASVLLPRHVVRVLERTGGLSATPGLNFRAGFGHPSQFRHFLTTAGRLRMAA